MGLHGAPGLFGAAQSTQARGFGGLAHERLWDTKHEQAGTVPPVPVAQVKLFGTIRFLNANSLARHIHGVVIASLSQTSWHITSRVAAGVLGGYAFTRGFAAAGTMLLFAAGMQFDEATSLVLMLGFLVYLMVFCWAFVAASLVRVWCWLSDGIGDVLSWAALAAPTVVAV